ncbi:MAG: PEP-CTERM sorting domain-containing protein [Planctomycetales bacterium]|nr:PEP-CTERM sorting domain-containing protein [Planctomycetales bacterium]
MRNWIWLCVSCSLVTASAVQAQFEVDDLVFAMSYRNASQNIEHLRGAPEFDGGDWLGNPVEEAFIQAIEFDNYNSISHNPSGNLVGVNFGQESTGGSIYNLPTTTEGPGELIGDTLGMGGNGVSMSRLGGLSISPDNTKIAVTGYETGEILIYDYVAGDTTGKGASLSGARETSTSLLTQFDTQGTTWLDSTNVLAFASNGDIVSVDSLTMQTIVLTTLNTEGGANFPSYSEYTDLEYNPLVSPYLFASYARFDRDGGPRVVTLYALDPASNFDVVKTIDNSESMDTPREIAMDSQGNLYATQFRGPVELLGNVTDLDSMTDNSTVDWYTTTLTDGNGETFAPSFSGLDAAVGLPIEVVESVRGDYNADLQLTAEDIDTLSAAIQDGLTGSEYDLNGDGSVNDADRTAWVVDLRNTYFGDSNLDGEFGTGDLVAVFAAGEYEDTTPGNSGWATGDWNSDGDFNTSDLVTAFGQGGFELGPRAAVAAVPEPASCTLLLTGLFALSLRRRRTHSVA